MQSQIIGDFIKIPMENHTLLINSLDNLIYLDGTYLKTTSAEPFMSKYVKKVNLPHIKRRISTIQSRNFTWVLTIGNDGRIFLHKFTHENYLKFRGKPELNFSFWDDKKCKIKMFFEGNLQIPAFVRRYD